MKVLALEGLEGLAQLLEELGVGNLGLSADERNGFGVVYENMRRQEAARDAHLKAIIGAMSESTEVLLKHLSTDACDHREHRIVPEDSRDTTALFNLLEHITDLHVDMAKRVAHSAYETGMMVAKGEKPQGKEHVLEATFGVLNGAVLELTHLINANGVSDVRVLMREFDAGVRKRVADAINYLSSGGNPPERPRHDKCH